MSGLRGTAHPSSKLTEDQVREIRRLLKAGQSLAELAKRFGVRALAPDAQEPHSARELLSAR